MAQPTLLRWATSQPGYPDRGLNTSRLTPATMAGHTWGECLPFPPPPASQLHRRQQPDGPVRCTRQGKVLRRRILGGLIDDYHREAA